MRVEEMEQAAYADIFSKPSDQITDPQVRFGSEERNTDILNTPPVEEAKVDETEKPKEGEEVKLEEANILGDEIAKPSYDFKDISGYFEDRLNSGRFVAIEQDDAEGKTAKFIPKTPEEFDEVIDIQVNYQLEKKLEDMENQWYAAKSPAWQMVAKYSELANSPEEILPFLQGVRNFNSISTLDPEDINQAEKIVRARLSQRGDDEDVIAETIDSLKTTDKLVSTAQKYKPVIMAQEKQELANMVEQQRRQEQEYNTLATKIREEAIKAIESPFIGKSKLKQDEKAAIYDLIAEPSRETKGYPIYSAIDNLFESNDFDTLKQIALLLSKKESYLNYIKENASQTVAASLQAKLRVAGEAQTGGGKDTYTEEGRKTIQRTQYSSSPRFGR